MKTKERKGKVYIVGAGPGDPALITLRAIECIKEADVILYDRLVSKDILKYRRPECILEYVGKSKDGHKMSQDKVNALILKHANGLNIVVRLKGGDPFIFGRGAEEILFLISYGIKCEVIPGVSSFYAVPELRGIPLTHRGLASGFLVITGHEDHKKGSNSVDWKTVARFSGTVVMLMGKSNLRRISKKLIANGMDKNKPCAVVSKGTTIDEKFVSGSIINIAVKSKHLPAPSVVVIGDVVNLRHKLNHGTKPLSKKRYLSTATDSLSKDIARKLRHLGASIDRVPMIKISPNKDYSVLDRTILNVEKFDWLVFTSRHGVIYFLRRFFELNTNIKDLTGKIACVGSGTAAELIKHKIFPSLLPQKFTTKDLGLTLKASGLAGKNIALLHTKREDDLLRDTLSKAGGTITDCVVYNVEPSHNPGRLQKMISKNPDGILFLSPKSVNHFFDLISEETKDGLKKSSSFFSIGPVTGKALKQRGINRVFSPAEHTIEGLLNLCVKEA